MILLPYAVAAAAVIACAAWLYKVTRRKPRNAEELINPVSQLARNLYPFIEPRDDSKDWSDESLWKIMGGVSGLREMHRDAGTLMTLVLQISEDSAGQLGVTCDEIVCECIYLRLQTWGALAENAAKRTIPCLPRIQARSCARLYCDIASSFDVLLSLR